MYPERRISGLVERALEVGLLVYDLNRRRAHCLNATAAAVWQRCDGHTSVEAITREVAAELGAPVDAELVWQALTRLQQAKLLAGPLPARAAVTRREAARRVAAAGVLSGLLPVVHSILAATGAEAAMCLASRAACATGAQRCSGIFVAGAPNNVCQ